MGTLKVGDYVRPKWLADSKNPLEWETAWVVRITENDVEVRVDEGPWHTRTNDGVSNKLVLVSKALIEGCYYSNKQPNQLTLQEMLEQIRFELEEIREKVDKLENVDLSEWGLSKKSTNSYY